MSIMLFSVLAAMLTAFAAAVLIYPLLVRRKPALAMPSGQAAVYADQLSELDRDLDTGLITREDAAYARAEIGRRLMAASAPAAAPASNHSQGQAQADGSAGPADETSAPRRRRRVAEAVVILALPIMGLCLYGTTGRPDLPDQPLAARLANPGNDLQILVAKAERHLAANPDDGRGWDVLAPIYLSTNRLEDAARAFRNAIRLQGPSPARLGGLSDALMAASGGAITEEAHKVLEQAARADPDNPRIGFYLALSLEQSGRKAEAEAAFRKLADRAPADAPWLPLVRSHLGETDQAQAQGQAQTQAQAQAQGQTQPPAQAPAKHAPGPDAAAVADAAEMTPEARRQMIDGMVAGLDAKLASNPRDIEGWLRLVRSHSVLGNRDKAQAALDRGLAVFPPPSQESGRLLQLGRELGLKGQETTP